MVETRTGLWHICLLGSLTVHHEERRETRLRSKKAGGLLAYLAYFSGQTFSREALADIFWADSDPDMARQNLRATLAILRRQFEPVGLEGVMLMADRECVWIDSDAVTTDVSLFHDLVKEAQSLRGQDRARLLAEAVRLHRGPLMAGHEGSWILPQQLQLEEEGCLAAVQAVEAYCESGDPLTGIVTGKAALAKWPAREDIHIAVMKAQAAAGKPNDAIKQFEDLERLLDDLWGERPSAAAVEALENLPRDLLPPVKVPEPVLQAPGLKEPREMPQQRIRHKIPSRYTSFIGRKAEIEHACSSIDPSSGGCRLLTVMGPGGCGKTRLALEVAKRLAETVENVWFVPLADTEEASQAPIEIRKALGLAPAPRSDPMTQVIGFLADETGVLVIDNFEQIVDQGAETVARILEECPGVTCLVTSRRALLIEPENLLLIRPLAVAPRDADFARVAECEAVRLFVDRAKAVRQDFRLSHHNVEAVAELCRRLDGLPLALELAASRASSSTPAQILGRIGEASEALTNRLRNTPERHRSLRSVVDWSVRLLTEESKAVFLALSVFRGGWSHEGAAFVCPGTDVGRQLQALVDSSLIQAEANDESMRFSMLEAVRDLAYHLLEETGNESTVRDRHLGYFAELASALAPELIGPRQGQIADQFETEMDNLREAVAWGLTKPTAPEAALRIMGNIRYFFGFRGHSETWLRFADALVDLPYDGDTGALTVAHLARASLAFYRGDYAKATASYGEADRLAEAGGHPTLRAEAVAGLGITHRASGDFEAALGFYQKALGLCTGEASTVACRVHYNTGQLEEFLEHIPEAKSHYEESLRLAELTKDLRLVARNRDSLGRCALAEDNPEKAMAQHQRARQLFAEVGDRAGEAEVIGNIALMELKLGNTVEALSLFRESLAPLWAIQNAWELRSNIVLIALCATRLGDLQLAARALALKGLFDQRLAVEMSRQDKEAYDQALSLVREGVKGFNLESAVEEAGRRPLASLVLGLATV